nr:integrase, catalytic region, zinc finger, CCHC-type, peptidase aspartic, catalytic [Tanacetum cinerariifolium]
LKQAQKKQQSLYDGKVLLEKHDPPVVHDSVETLQLAQESREKLKQLNKEIKPANYTKINYLSWVFVSQTAKSREELYFSNDSKTANVSETILIPNEEFSDDTTPAKFVGDFKSLTKEADESLAKQKALELEIERHLRAVVSQDIMSTVQKTFVVDTLNLQTELERTKEHFKNCIIKKENEYAKLWNDWLLNYARENAHLKATYKNLFDSISVSQTQTITIIASLQNELQSTIYKNAKLRTQLFKKVSDQKDNTHDTSANTKIAKQSIMENLPKIDKTHALSKPVTSNSVSTPQESKVMKNDNVIAPGMFRINPFKTSREEKHVPNTVSASNRTKPITVSQPPVFTKKDVNSDSNGLSSTGVDNTKTRRPQPSINTKNDRVPSASKSSRSKNKEVEAEEYHRNLLLSKNNKHISFACNNTKIDSQNVISKVVCTMCKQCLISVNHDVIQICLWCVNSDCSKHMTGNLKLLINFVWKFMGTVRFGNDHVAAILGFGDLQLGNILITRVYFVEGLGHNLFLVGQFCDSDLEVVFRRNACFVRNLEGVDLLKGDHSTNLYIINLHEMASASPICLMARASSTKSKDEAPEVIITFLKRIKVLLQSPVIIIRTDNDTKFKNQVLKEYFDTVGISHQMSFAEAIATTCFIQNRSIIHCCFNKTPYELINGRKSDISFLYVFGALCYPKNDHEDIEKLGAKGLDLTYTLSTITTQQPIEGELILLFEAMYDDYIGGKPSATARTVPPAQEPHVRQTSTASTTIADTAPTPTNLSSHATNILITSHDVYKLNPNAMFNGNMFVNPFASPSTSAAESSSSHNVDPSNMYTFYQPYPHEFQWTKDHPLEQVIREPSRHVLTRNQLRSDGDMCMYTLTVSTMEPKNVKEAMSDPAWIDSMQEELLQFKRLDVLVLVPTQIASHLLR